MRMDGEIKAKKDTIILGYPYKIATIWFSGKEYFNWCPPQIMLFGVDIKNKRNKKPASFYNSLIQAIFL